MSEHEGHKVEHLRRVLAVLKGDSDLGYPGALMQLISYNEIDELVVFFQEGLVKKITRSFVSVP